MAEADLKKASGITGTIDVNVVNTPDVNLTDRCARLLGQLCVSGSPIDPRAIRALTFLTDSVDVSGSLIDISDRCARSLGQLCFGGVPIDPRQIRALTFLNDKVDVSGSTVTTASGSLVTMEDAFMELRLMADMLKDLPLALNPSTSRVRVDIEASSTTITITGTLTAVTNIVNIGGVAANSLILDTMDIVWNTGIRTNGII